VTKAKWSLKIGTVWAEWLYRSTKIRWDRHCVSQILLISALCEPSFRKPLWLHLWEQYYLKKYGRRELRDCGKNTTEQKLNRANPLIFHTSLLTFYPTFMFLLYDCFSHLLSFLYTLLSVYLLSFSYALSFVISCSNIVN